MNRIRQLQRLTQKHIDALYVKAAKAIAAEAAAKAKTQDEAEKIALELAAKGLQTSAEEIARGVAEQHGLSEAEHDFILDNLREFQATTWQLLQ